MHPLKLLTASFQLTDSNIDDTWKSVYVMCHFDRKTLDSLIVNELKLLVVLIGI